MTVKDLYYLAKAGDWVDAKILIDYECDDDWYSFENIPIERNNLHYKKHRKELHITLL